MGEAQNGVNVVVLDACRDNPFRGFRTLSRGLAQTRAPKGTLIAYATAPGDVAADGDGRNGIFTGHLLQAFREPGLQIEQVFKKAREAVDAATGGRQVPWTSSSLVGELVLAKKEPAPASPPPPVVQEGALELALWEEVKDSEAVAELRAYLRSYPEGTFSELARLRVLKLEILPPRQPRPGQEWTDPGTGMTLRYIPAGKFMMGSPKDEVDREEDEIRHEVELTRGYWMGETEVTHGQWLELMGNNPSAFSSCGDDCPVETVSWYDAVTFANRLSEKAELPGCYELTCEGSPGEKGYVCSTVELKDLTCEGYRLPTEAEWEHASGAEGEGASGALWLLLSPSRMRRG